MLEGILAQASRPPGIGSGHGQSCADFVADTHNGGCVHVRCEGLFDSQAHGRARDGVTVRQTLEVSASIYLGDEGHGGHRASRTVTRTDVCFEYLAHARIRHNA